MCKNLKYILILAIGFSGLIFLEWLRPTPIDWSLSFVKGDKIPYGCYVLFRLLPEIFPGQRIAATGMPAYNILRAGSAGLANYVFVNVFFAPDKLDTRELLAFVARGNQVFVAAHGFAAVFADTLRFATDSHFINQDSVSINFVNSALQAPENFKYKSNTISHYFSRFDTLRTTALGKDDRGRINFVKIAFGQGAFYLSTVPMAFVNYHLLLRNNAEYAFKALSYLPVQATFWDEYYKTGRQVIKTPLRYVLSQEPLRWAYYLALAGVILFIVFNGRRRQRIIPVILPKTNTTLEFVKTVGRLYFQHGDHKNMAEKKIAHFLDYLRTHYYLKTDAFDRTLCEKLAEKSGVEVEAASALFKQIKNIHAQPQITEAELSGLNRAIERFHGFAKAQKE
jgi:hypothetical protein